METMIVVLIIKSKRLLKLNILCSLELVRTVYEYCNDRSVILTYFPKKLPNNQSYSNHISPLVPLLICRGSKNEYTTYKLMTYVGSQHISFWSLITLCVYIILPLLHPWLLLRYKLWCPFRCPSLPLCDIYR